MFLFNIHERITRRYFAHFFFQAMKKKLNIAHFKAVNSVNSKFYLGMLIIVRSLKIIKSFVTLNATRVKEGTRALRKY